MNQILMTENKKKKSKLGSAPAEITSIVRFFAIALIVFGIFFIGQGSYAIYKEAKGRDTSNMPIVSIERVNDTAIVKVESSNIIISRFIYSWNDDGDEQEHFVDGTYVEEEIMLPLENSVLNIKIEDETGRMIKYKKEFIIEGIDIAQPTIEVAEENSDGSIKITATDETAISYITYKINEEDEIRIDKSELENKSINYILKLPRGENIVIITAVDEAGNIETMEKPITVTGESKIENARVENGKLSFVITNPDGVRDVEINFNGQVYEKKDINAKEVPVSLKLVQGSNIINIKITDIYSIVTTVTQEINY